MSLDRNVSLQTLSFKKLSLMLSLLAGGLSSNAVLAETPQTGSESFEEDSSLTFGEVVLEEITENGNLRLPLNTRFVVPSAEEALENYKLDRQEKAPSINVDVRINRKNKEKEGSDTGVEEFDKIYNVGEKIWKVVEAGKPVVTTDMKFASALPEGVTDWKKMSGWQEPIARSYRYSAKNLYGVTVLDFMFKIIYIYGGSDNGKGAYLARVAVVAEKLDVAWGYTFNAEASVPSVTNVGTLSSPIAGAELLVKWKLSTVLKSSENSGSFFVRGDGRFKQF